VIVLRVIRRTTVARLQPMMLNGNLGSSSIAALLPLEPDRRASWHTVAGATRFRQVDQWHEMPLMPD